MNQIRKRLFVPAWFIFLAIYTVFSPKIGVYILGLYIDSKKQEVDEKINSLHK